MKRSSSECICNILLTVNFRIEFRLVIIIVSESCMDLSERDEPAMLIDNFLNA